MSEHQEQSAFVLWFKMQYPAWRDCIVSLLNGAHIAGDYEARVIKIGKHKSEGLKAGASDLFIAVPAHGLAGLWLEMKDVGKTKSALSSAQLDHILLMRRMGYAAEWAAGFDSARRVVRAYLAGELRYE